MVVLQPQEKVEVQLDAVDRVMEAVKVDVIQDARDVKVGVLEIV